MASAGNEKEVVLLARLRMLTFHPFFLKEASRREIIPSVLISVSRGRYEASSFLRLSLLIFGFYLLPAPATKPACLEEEVSAIRPGGEFWRWVDFFFRSPHVLLATWANFRISSELFPLDFLITLAGNIRLYLFSGVSSLQLSGGPGERQREQGKITSP